MKTILFVLFIVLTLLKLIQFIRFIGEPDYFRAGERKIDEFLKTLVK